MVGFWDIEDPEIEHAVSVPRCGSCGLYKECRSPKMEVEGPMVNGNGVLVVGEGPYEQDDKEGRIFVSKSGHYLRRELRSLGLSLKETTFTNAIICHSGERPTPQQMDYCRPNLTATVNDMKPSVILLLGTAVASFMKSYWKTASGKPSRFYGYAIPHKELNAWVIAVANPRDVLAYKDKNPVEEVLFRQQLDLVRRVVGTRPFPKGAPDYNKQVEVVQDPKRAAAMIRYMTKKGGVCAWDYETNMLKPEASGSVIYSASICWRGKKTIAFPWEGDVPAAMSEFLRSKNTYKIASNLKFEERWSLVHLGHGCTNWMWDTMIAAHLIDNREEVTSVKYQAFVLLGEPDWTSKVESYISSDGPSQPNRLAQVSLRDLLMYNGMDSVLEYYVAKRQMELQKAHTMLSRM